VIEIDVNDKDGNRPIGKLSETPSKAWREAFDSVILWTKQRGDKPDIGDVPIPQAVRDAEFKIVKDELQMRLTFGNSWRHVKAFTEDVAIAYANKITS
jgi:hypothetical protein